MSMKSSIVYGYGFNVGEIETTKMVDFIKNHKEAFCSDDYEKDIFNSLENAEDGIYTYDSADDYFIDMEYECDEGCSIGCGSVVANIMARETGIRFEYQQGDGEIGSKPAVMFSESYPWDLNEAEKNLTKDKCEEICKKYMQELGIDGYLGYLEVEYFG